MPFEVGRLIGDYEVLGVLGCGGMGEVYRVRNLLSNRMEAMKVLLADLTGEADVAERFMGEIRTLARLEHPNIAKFYTAFKSENQVVMIMEYVDGVTLADEARKARLPLEKVLDYVRQILSALSYAHENGVIHRDIKPSNAMVTTNETVKLMDFGIAKSNLDPLLTRPGTTVGSMSYMSPEQVRGNTVDARSDLYSVGVVLYELATGSRPFEGENTFSILEKQLNTMPQPPIELNPSLPAALNEIIMTALAKDPTQRFQRAEAFRKALQNVREGQAAAQAPTVSMKPSASSQQPTEYIPVPQSSPQTPARKSHRSLWMATGAIACTGVLIAAIIVVPHFWKTSADTGSSAPPAGISTEPMPSSQSKQSATEQTAPPVPGEASQSGAVAIPSRKSSPANQMDKSTERVGSKSERVGSRAARKVISQDAPEIAGEPEPGTDRVSPSDGAAEAVTGTQQSPVPASNPSADEIDKVNENLLQLRARAAAVKTSLDRLREQQGAAGLGIRQDIGGSASRLEDYLRAAETAVQSNALQSAQKNMDRAEAELTKLEAFFGK